MSITIPVSKPSISALEIQYLNEAATSGWISSSGFFVERFEEAFADFCGVKHCISTSNGTVAIHLALATLNIGAGDEVIIPDLTFAATANAVILAGASPVMVDVRQDNWCIEPAAILKQITEKTKAIIPVHLYGHPCNMNEINAIAKEYNLKVIEDAAEAHGACYQDRYVGALGDCATFSFYANKIITTGEGGCITTDSDAIAERARRLRDHGMSKEKRYWHNEVGYNYRMTNLQAAVGVAQLERIKEFIKERKQILETYRVFLPDIFRLNPQTEGTEPVNWLTCVLLPASHQASREPLLNFLHQKGIDTRTFFYPLTQMPVYQPYLRNNNGNAMNLSYRGFNLPTFSGLTQKEIQYICDMLMEATTQNLIVV